MDDTALVFNRSVMTARVIFLPYFFMPSDGELYRLARMQENIHYARLSYSNTMSRESDYDKLLSDIRYRNLVREQMRIVTSCSPLDVE